MRQFDIRRTSVWDLCNVRDVPLSINLLSVVGQKGV